MIPHNCLRDALDRWRDGGGFFVALRSRWYGGVHVVHVSREGEISNYAPHEKLDHPLLALLGFEGALTHTVPPEQAQPVSTGWIVISAWIMALGATGWALGRLVRRIRRCGRSSE